MILREYQQKSSDAVFEEWKEVDSTLLVLPTGCGKTIVFADVIRRMQPKRAIVVAHREELIWQARDKIGKVTGLECDIEMADMRAADGLFGKAPVLISTVQTQNSNSGSRTRMGRFSPSDFGLLIIDEAHHATSPSYKNVINYYTQNPDLRVLGVTATPDRADEEALGQVFKSVAFDYEILDAIHDGWLVPIEQVMVHISGLDFSQMRTTAGDLNGADLAAVMESERNLLGVADATMKILESRRAIVFTASVKQAEQLCDIFNRHKSGSSSWVCGETPKDDRRQILSEFASGRTQIVCNCGVLTEGFDDSGVEVIVMARPTKSRSLYSQMVGRSTRPLPGVVDGHELDTPEQRKASIESSTKKSCLVVDFVGNSGRHKLMTSADILGGKVSDKAIERAIAKAEKLGKPVRMSELLDEEDAQIQIEEAKERERIRRLTLVAQAQFKLRKVSPFDAFDITPVKSRGWDTSRTLSEKQRALLLKQGIDPSTLPYTQARQLIGEIFNRWNGKLCTYKQAALLSKHGIDAHDMTMKRASEIIDRIASNRWVCTEEIRALATHKQ